MPSRNHWTRREYSRVAELNRRNPIRNRLNFTLTTDRGDIDLLGEVAGRETYQTLLPHSFELEAFGIRFKCIDLPTLIRIKEAPGRRKDLEAIAELRVLLEEIDKKQT